MRAFHRVPTCYRRQGLSLWTARICCGKSEIGSCSENYIAQLIGNQEKASDRLPSSSRFYSSGFNFLSSYGKVLSLSSEASAKSSRDKDEDLENEFPELGIPDGVAEETTSDDESDDILSSKSEIPDEADVSEELFNDHVGDTKPLKLAFSALTDVIVDSLPSSLSSTLDKWVEEGNQVTEDEVSRTMTYLRRRKNFAKALQFSEWLESNKYIEFSERDYASNLDLVGKLYGIRRAEEYMERIPESFRGELVYGSLLAICTAANNVKKAEEVFDKMRQLEFPLSSFSCNQLLILYRRNDRKKMANVLVMMDKEKVKPSVFTYEILVNAKGKAKDIVGMEQIFETMKAEGIKPNSKILLSLARHYASARIKDKAEEILKELEGDDLTAARTLCRLLLPIYASLGRDDEVGRVWKICELDPRLDECAAAIEAWGQLNRIENAEAAFEELLKRVEKKPSTKHFCALLKVYADHNMPSKGIGLVRRMAAMGCTIGPMTWDPLVSLYIGAGQVDKAARILDRAVKKKKERPMFSSFLSAMEKYAERGDIHNTEKIYLMMRQCGYPPQMRPYQILLQAYIIARVPAYGFRERMRGDGIIPAHSLASQLARSDAFWNSQDSEVDEWV